MKRVQPGDQPCTFTPEEQLPSSPNSWQGVRFYCLRVKGGCSYLVLYYRDRIQRQRFKSSSPFSPVPVRCLSVQWRPPLRAQNCSCSKPCLRSHPLCRSRELMSHWSVLMSSARHKSCMKLLESSWKKQIKWFVLLIQWLYQKTQSFKIRDINNSRVKVLWNGPLQNYHQTCLWRQDLQCEQGLI